MSNIIEHARILDMVIVPLRDDATGYGGHKPVPIGVLLSVGRKNKPYAQKMRVYEDDNGFYIRRENCARFDSQWNAYIRGLIDIA